MTLDKSSEYRQLPFTRPPGAAELLLVRHGESAPWREGETFSMVDGQGDPPLDAAGEEQAERVAERLADEGVAAIYVTPLLRTAQTAAPLAARLGLVPIVEDDMREVFLGEWEGGVFRKRLVDRHPIAVRMLEEERWDVIPGAECMEAFAARVQTATDRIALRHPDECVAVFTHGGVIAQVVANATGARTFAFLGDNASISHLVVHEGRPIVRRYNDTTHLHHRFTVAPEPIT